MRDKSFHSDPAYRAKQSAASRGQPFHDDPGYRQKLSTAAKVRWRRPSYRQKQKLSSKEKRSAALKLRWSDPNYREKMSAAQKKHWRRDPEYRSTVLRTLEKNHQSQMANSMVGCGLSLELESFVKVRALCEQSGISLSQQLRALVNLGLEHMDKTHD